MATINTTLNDVLRTTSIGSRDTAIGDAYYGINHRGSPAPISINRDTHGLTFFTRPQLNLTPDNASVLALIMKS